MACGTSLGSSSGNEDSEVTGGTEVLDVKTYNINSNKEAVLLMNSNLNIVTYMPALHTFLY